MDGDDRVNNKGDMNDPIEDHPENSDVDDNNEEGSRYACVNCGFHCSSSRDVSRYTSNFLNLTDFDPYDENYICKRCKKNNSKDKRTPMEEATDNFLAACKEMPCYVCTSCHRVLFQKSVRALKMSLYGDQDTAAKKVLSKKYRHRMANGREWICNTCHTDLRENKVPAQSVCNNLELSNVPKIISDLSNLEVRCISLRIPFMKIHSLRKGNQGKISGPCVNVPATVEAMTTEVLPRLPEDIHMIVLKLKRKLTFKSHHKFGFIRPHKVLEALVWLKANHPHYENIIVDHLWEEKMKKDELGQILLGGEMKQKDLSTVSETKIPDSNKKSVSEKNKTADISDQRDDIASLDQELIEVENVETSMTDVKVVEELQEKKKEDPSNSNEDEDAEKKAELNFQEEQQEVDRKAEMCIEPSSTCLQVEDLESTVFSIAPGENSIPKYILLDDDFETLSFPHLFPFGKGAFGEDIHKERKLDLRRYINQRLLNVDTRFSQDLEYIFAQQYACELKQLRSAIQLALRKMSINGSAINAGFLKSRENVQGLVMKDFAYKFMKNVRGTPAYWQQQLFDTLAMLRTLGTPTFFLTLSAAEFLWPSFIVAVARCQGEWISETEVATMDWNKKAQYLRRNPVVTVQMFQHRVESFFKDFLMSDAHPLGKLKEYCIKIEFQARGSPHAHCLLWIENAPKINEQSDEEVIAFCDRHISGELPDENGHDQELAILVKRLQTHVHSPYCRKDSNSKCRFNFPRPPTPKTLLARSKSDSIDEEVDPTLKRKVLQCVRTGCDKSPEDTIEEILKRENIDQLVYDQCLKESNRGASVVFKREPKDLFTNNYNPMVTRLWGANTDIQFVADAYAAIMYVLSYVMKSEKGMSDCLKQAAKEKESDGVKEQMTEHSRSFFEQKRSQCSRSSDESYVMLAV